MRKSISYFIVLIFLLPTVLFANELFVEDDLACQNGDGKQCLLIGFSFDVLNGALYAEKGDQIKAIEYYQKACDLKAGSACSFAGIIYYLDKNDIEEAKELFTKGCKLEDKLSCEYLTDKAFR